MKNQPTIVLADDCEFRLLVPAGLSCNAVHVVAHRRVKTPNGVRCSIERTQLHAVARWLRSASAIVLAGLDAPKLTLRQFLDAHHPAIAARISSSAELPACCSAQR